MPVDWREPRQLAFALVSFLALIALLPAQSAASQRLLPSDRNVIKFDVSAGSRGFAAVAWIEGKGPDSHEPETAARSAEKVSDLYVRIRPETGEGFSRRSLVASGATEFAIAASKRKELLMAWTEPSGSYLRVWSASGEWGRTQLLSTDGALREFDASEDGTAVIALTSEENAALTFIRDPSGTVSSPFPVGSSDEGLWLAVAATGAGRADVAWGSGCRAGGPSRNQLVGSLSFEGGVDTVQEIENTACPDAGLQLASNPRGQSALLARGDLASEPIRLSQTSRGGVFRRARVAAGRNAAIGESYMGIMRRGSARIAYQLSRVSASTFVQTVNRSGATRKRVEVADNFNFDAFDMNPSGQVVLSGQSLRNQRIKLISAGLKRRCRKSWSVSPRLTRRALADSQVAIGEKGKILVLWTEPRVRSGGGRGLFVSSHRSRSC